MAMHPQLLCQIMWAKRKSNQRNLRVIGKLFDKCQFHVSIFIAAMLESADESFPQNKIETKAEFFSVNRNDYFPMKGLDLKYFSSNILVFIIYCNAIWMHFISEYFGSPWPKSMWTAIFDKTLMFTKYSSWRKCKQ